MFVDATFWRWSCVYALNLAATTAVYGAAGVRHGSMPYVLAAWCMWLGPDAGLRQPDFLEVVSYLVVVPLGALLLGATWYTPYLSPVLGVLLLVAREWPLGRVEDSARLKQATRRRYGDLSPASLVKAQRRRVLLALRQVALILLLFCYATGLPYYAQYWHDREPLKMYALMAGVAWLDRLLVRPHVRRWMPRPRLGTSVYLHAWFALPWYTVVYSLPNAANVFVLHLVAPDTWNAGHDQRVDATLWVQTLALSLGVGMGHLAWKHALVHGRYEYYGLEEFLLRVLITVFFSFYFAEAEDAREQREGGNRRPDRSLYRPLHASLNRKLLPSSLVMAGYVTALGLVMLASLMGGV